MTEPYANADEVIDHNLRDVLENGPRLAFGRRTVVMAYDPEAQRVLLGGLGGMGVGTMWVGYNPGDHDVTGAPVKRSEPPLDLMAAIDSILNRKETA